MLCAKELYQQSNQLPPLEKLHLAELLLADLDTPDPEIDTIWRDEAQKRWQAYRAGELKAVSYEAVMQKSTT
jgi:putative addiction module component (TIGR02574 family)